MTINKAMNISLSGLTANQAALNVVSHNIANMNTEGYVKQRVNFAEVRTNIIGCSGISGQIASLSGVKVASITTASNDYLNNYYRKINTIYEGLQAGADIAGQVSNLMDELSGAGLGDTMSSFFEAANSLNQNPTDYSLRINFIEKAKAVANKFNSMDTTISNYKESLVGNGLTKESAENSQAGNYVTQLNDKLQSLADINRRITANANDSSLISQRDQILSEISGLANVTTSISPMGTASVKIGKTDLVLSSEVVGKLDIAVDGKIKVIPTDGSPMVDVTSNLTAGALGGLLTGMSSVDKASTGLDSLANAFADYMNQLQTQADANGTPCYYDRVNDKLVESNAANVLFQSSDGSAITAANIGINMNIYDNPDLIAAARLDTSGAPATWEKSVGNGNNALLFYNAKDERLASLGGLSMENYMISLSTRAALDAGDLQARADTQGALLDNIANQILSETGVNLDEELSNMIMYQQAYNASARVFSACVEVYDKLVALGT